MIFWNKLLAIDIWWYQRLSWSKHIQQICRKGRRLVGVLYRQFYKWADSSVLRSIYIRWIRPHLEYAVQLWDPYIMKDIRMLESVQKFACKVCLKCWDMDYDNMLHCLNLPRLSERRQYLKLLTLYNIVNGHLFFPEGIFVLHRHLSLRHNSSIYCRPRSHTNYFLFSCVPSVITLCNNLPLQLKSSSLSTFKSGLYNWLMS